MDGNWTQFLDKLRPLLKRTDNLIVAKLTRKFFSTSLCFQSNAQTKKLLNCYIDRIRESPSNVYVILLELKLKLKNYQSLISEKILPLPDTSESVHSKRRVTFTTLTEQMLPEEDDILSSPLSRKRKNISVDVSTTSSRESTEISNNSKQDSVGLDLKTAPVQQGETASSHFKLRVLERRMEFLSRKIRRMEEMEMDVNELGEEESAYLRLDSLKRQYLTVWRQFCRLRGISRHACSFSRLPFHYSGCRFAVINQAVERYINSSRIFPDYETIHRVVQTTSDREGLDLSAMAIETLARDIFTDVGASLKRRREREFKHDFGCHLTDAEPTADVDPALHSAELRLRLLENERIAARNIKSVLTKYSQLQEDIEDRKVLPDGFRHDHTPAVDLDVSDIDEPTDQLAAPPTLEPSSNLAQLDETPLPITSVDASIKCPIFREEFVDLEDANRLPMQVGEEEIETGEEVPPIESFKNPPETITISDSEEEAEEEVEVEVNDDELQIVGCEYWPPRDSHAAPIPRSSPATQAIMTGQRIALLLPNGGSMLISSSQQRVVQIIPPMGRTQ